MRHRVLIALCVGWASFAAAAEPIRIDFVMFKDPPLVERVSPLQYSEKLKPLWVRALEHTEFDLQRQAALTIERAHRNGMPGLKDTAEALLKTLEQPDAPDGVRVSAARALVAIEARTSAAGLAALLKSGDLDYARVVEPALAEWDYQPAREMWLARLSGAGVSRRLQVLAIRGLGRVREAKAAGPLQKLVTDASQAGDLRLEAAGALSKIQRSGLEETARSLAASSSAAGVIDRLAAVRLLDEHADEAAVGILQSLARDPEPAVAGAALSRLLAIDPDHVLPHTEWGAVHADARVRSIVAQALAARPSPERIRLLSTLLDDPHPTNRQAVRESLRHLAERDDLKPAVIESAVAMLASDRWRGLEQSALLLGFLDHKPVAARLVELLDFSRLEVGIAAAWGLRQFAVPETLPAMHEKAIRETARRKGSGGPAVWHDWTMALVFETFGLLNFAPADAVMREYVPKSQAMGDYSRACAIWALGHLHAGKAIADLTASLLERANDNGIPPESTTVRSQSAIAIGRMNTKSAADNLDKLARVSAPPLSLACAWAVERLTGRKIVFPDPPPRFAVGWFLEPIDKE